MTTLCNGPRTGCMLLIAAVLIGTGVAQEAAPSPFASRFLNLRESPNLDSWLNRHKGPSPPFVQPPAEPPAKAPQPTSYTVWYKLTVSINRVGGDGWLGGDAEIVGKAAGKEVFRILAKKGYYGASGLVPLDGRVYEKTYPYDPSVATVLLPDDSKELNFHIFEEDGDGFFDQLYFFTVRQLELRLTPGITRGNADVHWNVKCGSLYRWERFRKDNCDFVVTVTHQRGIEWHY